MSKKFVNELVQLDPSVFTEIAGNLPENEQVDLVLQASAVMDQSRSEFDAAKRMFDEQARWEAEAVRLEESRSALQGKLAKISASMRDTEEWNVRELLKLPAIAEKLHEMEQAAHSMGKVAGSIVSNYKIQAMTQFRRDVRNKLVTTDKYAGWVIEGQALTEELEKLPGMINQANAAAKKARHMGDIMASKGRVLAQEAESIMKGKGASLVSAGESNDQTNTTTN